jgi:hypothetical protein
MSVRREAAKLLKDGLSPIEVADKMGKSVYDLTRMLLLQVGEAELRLSDIFFRIPEVRRLKYEELIKARPGKSLFSWQQSCRARHLNAGEFHLYLLTKSSPQGDMYTYLRDLEVSLHQLIRQVLESAFRSHDDAWWYEGIPEEIRKNCVTTKETDAQHLEPYAYTTLIHLKMIIDKHWPEFVAVLPKGAADKKCLLRKFDRLNMIRNAVMHPIKPISITEGDFEFIRDFRSLMDASQWQLGGGNSMA